MQWFSQPTPKEGEKRIFKKFLIFPKCIHNKWKWLEIATFKSKYISGWGDSYWLDLNWIENEEVCECCLGIGTCPKCKGTKTTTWIDKIKEEK